MSTPPTARIARVGSDGVVIVCPLCGEQHLHAGWTRNVWEHRAAACGLYAPVNADSRALGYRFRVRRPDDRREASA